MEDEQQSSARFIKILRYADLDRCLVDLDGPCDEKPVQAHFIPKSSLEHLAGGPGKKIRALYSLHWKARVDTRPFPDQLLDWEVFPKSAASLPFICRKHEQLFWKIEQNQSNFENPRDMALLAYRTLLAELYIQERSRQAGILDEQRTIVVNREKFLRFFMPLKHIVRQTLIENEYRKIRNCAIVFDTKGKVASAGVVPSFPIGSAWGIPFLSSKVPISSSPMVVNILPRRDCQVFLLTYAEKDLFDGQHFLDRIHYSNDSFDVACLSKILLEELDVILISKDVWASYGSYKQKFIADHSYYSRFYPEIAYNVRAERLDLFARH